MAKKKLSHHQKRKQKKQRRARRQQQDPAQRLIKRVRREGINTKFIRNPPEQVKMSDVLFDFIAPYYDAANSDDAVHRLITTALIAWNTALQPEEERAASLAKIVTALPEEAHADFFAIVGEMIERKQEHFAQYNRMIIDYELVDRGGNYHISVMSTMPGQSQVTKYDPD